MADIADNGVVFHLCHVGSGNDMKIAGRGHKDIRLRHHIFQGFDFVTLHQRLQSADRVNFRDNDPRALAAQ